MGHQERTNSETHQRSRRLRLCCGDLGLNPVIREKGVQCLGRGWARRCIHTISPREAVLFLSFLGLQNRLHVPPPVCSRENQTQKRGGDSGHSHSLRVRGGQHPGARPAAARPEAAKGEDPLAQHAQHLPAGQRG